jgi:hypothetical protein
MGGVPEGRHRGVVSSSQLQMFEVRCRACCRACCCITTLAASHAPRSAWIECYQLAIIKARAINLEPGCRAGAIFLAGDVDERSASDAFYLFHKSPPPPTINNHHHQQHQHQQLISSTPASHPHPPAMDVLKAVQTYVVKMITEVPGMKVLLLDAHTVSCVWLTTPAVAHTFRPRSYPSSQRSLSCSRMRSTSPIVLTSTFHLLVAMLALAA